jgi:hypothetical protein
VRTTMNIDMGLPKDVLDFSTSESKESTDQAGDRGLVGDQGPSTGQRTGVVGGNLGRPSSWIEEEPRAQQLSRKNEQALSTFCCPWSKGTGVRDEPPLPLAALPLAAKGAANGSCNF